MYNGAWDSVWCLNRRDESYVGQIDLEDIRVICNRAVASPVVCTTNTDSGVLMDAAALDQLTQKQQHKILNNQRAVPAKQWLDSKADGDDGARTAGTADVLLESGRIVLQYRNIYAGVRPVENAPSKVHDPASGHVITAHSKAQTDRDYDMNDVVWKNMSASSTSKYQ